MEVYVPLIIIQSGEVWRASVGEQQSEIGNFGIFLELVILIDRCFRLLLASVLIGHTMGLKTI